MKNYLLVAFLLYIFQFEICLAKNLVVTLSRVQREAEKESLEINTNAIPKIYSMNIQTNISNRFATTLITSKVKNLKNVSAETSFSVVLPQNAFISEFSMEIDGKIYKAYIKEKEEAKQIYNDAKNQGQSAAKVEADTRDSNSFTVSVNIEPKSKTIFRLIYEELLQRELGRYEYILNIHPGQIVDDLDVEVRIAESRPLTFVKTPSLRTGNEISKTEDENLNPQAQIEHVNETSAVVKFKPDKEQQAKFAEFLNVNNKEHGIQGQFVVQYDVERDPKGGEVLVSDGYFVHFFAPENLKPLSKHVVFVLDHSGSMQGRKIEQLLEAMQNILSELKPTDVFNLVRFSDDALVWYDNENIFKTITIEDPNYGQLETILKEKNLPGPVKATKQNIQKAQNAIKVIDDLGSTNIIAGLEVGHFLLTNNRKNSTKHYQPMIIFLTDGEANIGIGNTDEIAKIITNLNAKSLRASIYSLSFGDYADKEFLQKLSLANFGFSRHIYEAADASLQLQDFYKKISSPLLSDVKFKYIDGVTDLTQNEYPIYFNGSEIIVAGKTTVPTVNLRDPQYIIECFGEDSGTEYLKPVIRESPQPSSKLERLWAYLTVKQLLEQAHISQNETEIKKKALDLSLKYSFVTEVSSLVVVRPDQNSTVSDLQQKLPEDIMESIAVAHRVDLAVDIRVESDLDTDADYIVAPSLSIFDSTQIPQQQTFDKPDAGVLNLLQTRIEELTNNTGTLTTPQGIFKFGLSNVDIAAHPGCPRSPKNETGTCTLLYRCPIFYSPSLNDTKMILEYFCPLENQYVGVCCPGDSIVTIPTP